MPEKKLASAFCSSINPAEGRQVSYPDLDVRGLEKPTAVEQWQRLLRRIVGIEADRLDLRFDALTLTGGLGILGVTHGAGLLSAELFVPDVSSVRPCARVAAASAAISGIVVRRTRHLVILEEPSIRGED